MTGAFRCDRCGGYGEEPERTLQGIGLDPSRDDAEDHQHELCRRCSMEFRYFIRGASIKRSSAVSAGPCTTGIDQEADQ